MFPIRDDNPTLGRSTVTVAIVALNVLAWVFVQGLGTEAALAKSVCELGAIPGELLGRVAPGTAVPLGPGRVCTIAAHPNWLTAVTHMFLHGGWFHLIGNLWFLWVFGDNVEDAMGGFRFAAFYLVCGLAAFAAHVGARLGREPLVIGEPERPVRRVAWCTGAAQGYFETAIALGVDAYVSGEISEQHVHLARESGVAFVAAGHHATEHFGVQAVGAHLAQTFGLLHRFIDVPSPV